MRLSPPIESEIWESPKESDNKTLSRSYRIETLPKESDNKTLPRSYRIETLLKESDSRMVEYKRYQGIVTERKSLPQCPTHRIRNEPYLPYL